MSRANVNRWLGIGTSLCVVVPVVWAWLKWGRGWVARLTHKLRRQASAVTTETPQSHEVVRIPTGIVRHPGTRGWGHNEAETTFNLAKPHIVICRRTTAPLLSLSFAEWLELVVDGQSIGRWKVGPGSDFTHSFKIENADCLLSIRSGQLLGIVGARVMVGGVEVLNLYQD